MPLSETGKMPVPQRVNFFIVGWASCPPEQAFRPVPQKVNSIVGRCF
ncbi:hypothetical protein AVDCRST_MAG84-2081 [uncultured Microcoleus sp.]|uniref:Uncharacterized protein n=1 Tax=uncultured Microcoleus sp. TaxID=259945 RepID=A0A6J4LLI3_9CYAN|nr:hypothetical protein AVDCRST_MAG84-2081 [uncultured Microcoleus sp.]